MKHFTIQLIDSGRQTRQWAIWANTLTVGSDPRSALVLPAPMPAHVGSFRSDAVVALPFGQLVVHEDTPARQRLWEVARERIAKSRLLGWNEPGEKGRNARAAILAGLGAIFAFASIGMYIEGGSRPLMVDDGSLPATIIDLVPDKPKDEPKPEPKPVEVQMKVGAEKPIQAPDKGGSSETRTQAWPPKSPANVMENSALGKIDFATDGLIGEDVDPNEKNMVDVILAGLGGESLKKTRGGHSGGDGDRLDAVGGIGLGNQGRAGFGRDRGAIQGEVGTCFSEGRPVSCSHAVTMVRTRAMVPPPKPSDIELGENLGTRSPESILRVIRTHIGGFRYSYDKALKTNAEIGGKISLRFTIAPSGDIVAIEIVSSSTGVASLDDEIKEKARRMKFDSIEKGNVTVTYAFVLDRQ